MLHSIPNHINEENAYKVFVELEQISSFLTGKQNY